MRKCEFPEGLIILSGRLHKDEGDTVRQGEILCEIDSEQLIAKYRNAVETAQAYYSAIAQAQANLMKAQASYEKTKKDYERYSSLLKEELVSKSEFDRVKMQYESAQAEVEAALKFITQTEASYRAAEQRLKEAQADLNETKIYSPADGVILSRPVEVGEVVNPGTVLYVLVDLNKL